MKRFKLIAAAAASLGGYVNRLNDYPVPFVDILVIIFWVEMVGHLIGGRLYVVATYYSSLNSKRVNGIRIIQNEFDRGQI